MHLPHGRKLLLFVGLSLLDLALSRWLIRPGYAELDEGNPIARWVLSGSGWAGLVSFKLAMVAVATLLFVVISRYRPRSGARALNLSCLAVGLVVLYSGYLIASNGEALADVHREEAKHVRLERESAKVREARVALERLAGDLAADRCTLAEACALFRRYKGDDAAWLSNLHRTFRRDSDEECLAVILMRHAVYSVPNDPAAAGRLADRLAIAFERQFGSPAPDLRSLDTPRGYDRPAAPLPSRLDSNLFAPHPEAASPPLGR